MKKYILTLPVLAFAFALAVSPAYASFNFNHKHHNKGGELTVSSTNKTLLNNYISTSSNTGNNQTSQSNSKRYDRRSHSHGSSIKTGTAKSLSEVQNTVGVNETYIDVYGKNKIGVSSKNYATVKNTVETSANSGLNAAWGGSIKTGKAVSNSVLWNFVGSNMTVIED
jgi:hypothetical protein